MNASRDNNGVDRISHLPEDIQTHILSFLDLKQAVQTSVLSWRWRYVWTQISHLKFDYKSFRCSCRYFKTYPQACFEGFVLSFITRHRGRVLQLRFIGDSGKFGNNFLKKIICFAACNGVQLLQLHNENPFSVPRCFYQCLQLRTVMIRNAITTQWFPFAHSSLKSLGILGNSGSLAGNIISGCSSLEHLSLINFEFRNVNIAVPSLKRLLLYRAKHYGGGDLHYESKIFLSTPALASVKLSCMLPQIYLSEDASSIHDLEIFYPFPLPDKESSETKICLRNVINLLRQFRGARSLTISFGIADLLLEAPDDLFIGGNVHFSNLRHLTFTTTKEDPFRKIHTKFIARFVKRPASLESIQS